MDLQKLELHKITDVEIEGDNPNEYPEFQSAFVSYGYYENEKRELSKLEIDYINEFRPEFVIEKTFEKQLC